MKTITATNYDNATKEAASIDKDLLKIIPAEIKDADKGVYHVLLVRKKHDPVRKQYLKKGQVQTYHKGKAFEKIAKNYARHDIDDFIIIHDPTQLSKGEIAPSLKAHEKNSIEASIRAEEKKAMEDRIKARTEKAQADKVAEKKQQELDAEKNKPKTRKELLFKGLPINEANVDDFAKDNQVDISKAKSFEKKLAIVSAWISNKAK